MAPEVIVDFIFERGLLFISVENIGDRPAQKVTVRFRQPVYGLGGRKDITSLAMFKNIEFLGPHKSIQTFLDSSQSYFERGEPAHVEMEVAYVDSEGHRYGGVIQHDLDIYRDIVYINSPISGQETLSGGGFGPTVVTGRNRGPGSVLGSGWDTGKRG